jgi:IS4 transposase
MHVQATVLSRLLQHIPWAEFDRAVDEHDGEKGCRGLNARSHLVALLTAQLIDANGLRDIEAAMEAQAPALKRRQIAPARRSTLSDANAVRPAAPFEAVIGAMLARLSPTKARYARRDLRLIDSTLVRPGAGAAEWARFESRCVAAKVHVVYDRKAEVPTFFELTGGNTNDITVAKRAMPIAAGATYAFDLGYYDYGFWAELDAQGCRFVTRLKKNTPLKVLAKRPVPAGCNVLFDHVVQLPSRLARHRRNPFSKPGRAIGVLLDSGRRIRVFTNDLKSSARTIAQLYKTRWQIELFFRWIKQNLHIHHFHGRSENAVRLQIAAAIIVYLMIKLAHAAVGATKAVAIFFKAVTSHLFNRIDINVLVQRIERRVVLPSSRNPAQLEFVL